MRVCAVAARPPPFAVHLLGQPPVAHIHSVHTHSAPPGPEQWCSPNQAALQVPHTIINPRTHTLQIASQPRRQNPALKSGAWRLHTATARPPSPARWPTILLLQATAFRRLTRPTTAGTHCTASHTHKLLNTPSDSRTHHAPCGMTARAMSRWPCLLPSSGQLVPMPSEHMLPHARAQAALSWSSSL